MSFIQGMKWSSHSRIFEVHKQVVYNLSSSMRAFRKSKRAPSKKELLERGIQLFFYCEVKKNPVHVVICTTIVSNCAKGCTKLAAEFSLFRSCPHQVMVAACTCRQLYNETSARNLRIRGPNTIAVSSRGCYFENLRATRPTVVVRPSQ